jgi:hypothetical protein
MLNQKDIVTKSLKVVDTKDVSIINNEDDDDYLFSALTCEGGGVFKKGIAIGMQEKMIPGLIMYDSENFFGYSEKYGLSLLSTHPEYVELNMPDTIFENKNVLQPIDKNQSEHLQNLKETTKDKRLNIDIEIKDTNNFYIIIPQNYSLSKFRLIFDISFLYDLNTIISNVSLVFINNSNKSLFLNIKNDNCYFENKFENELIKNSINKINCEIINEECFLITNKNFIRS